MIKLVKKAVRVNKPRSFSFSVDQASWYLILISARVKSEQQVSEDSTDGQDLTIKVDDLTFPYLTGHKRLIDSPAAFSGGTLKNKEKSVYFILYLDPGSHTIVLTPDQEATVTDVLYEELAIQDNKLTLSLNKQAEDGERRPFITFVLVDLPLSSFTLTAVTYKRYRDSDDLKIIIDSEVKSHFKETQEKPPDLLPLQWFYRFWYFVGAILLGKTTIAHFKTNLPKGLHYLEVWADRKPILESIEFDFGEVPPESTKIQKYKDDRYNQYDAAILEATNFWDEFFLTQQYPPPTPLDPNLVKAMIYAESRMGYGEASSDYAAYPDIMQVWDERNETPQHMIPEKDYKDRANEFVTENRYQHMSYSYPEDKKPPKVETPQESIFWGVRWLYHKAQLFSGQGEGGLLSPYERWWRSWREALYHYNISFWVKAYLDEVFSIYEKGIDAKGNVIWEKRN